MGFYRQNIFKTYHGTLNGYYDCRGVFQNIPCYIFFGHKYIKADFWTTQNY